MQKSVLNIKAMYDDGAFPLERAFSVDGGADIRTPYDFVLQPHKYAIIDTGVHVAIPKGYVGFLKSKSGINVTMDTVGEGVIDSGYTGSIKVKLYNLGDKKHSFAKGQKIIQLVILPCLLCDFVAVDTLDKTQRGDGGFGSTGK